LTALLSSLVEMRSSLSRSEKRCHWALPLLWPKFQRNPAYSPSATCALLLVIAIAHGIDIGRNVAGIDFTTHSIGANPTGVFLPPLAPSTVVLDPCSLLTLIPSLPFSTLLHHLPPSIVTDGAGDSGEMYMGTPVDFFVVYRLCWALDSTHIHHLLPIFHRISHLRNSAFHPFSSDSTSNRFYIGVTNHNADRDVTTPPSSSLFCFFAYHPSSRLYLEISISDYRRRTQ
jgi:hypothetical protein